MRLIAGATVLALLSYLCLVGVPAGQAQAPAALRVGVEGNYPPFSMVGPDGTLKGFDIDIAQALCARMGVQCTLVQQEWDGMIPSLNARKFDMIVASMTITAERRKAVDFSDPYYDVPSRWAARSGAFSEASPEALRGKTIIVLRNSPRAKHVRERYPDSKVLLVAREPDAYLELKAGRGDIAFVSSALLDPLFLKRPEGAGFAAVGDPVRLVGDSDVGIAVRKGETALRDRINEALSALKASGDYQRLAARYFDFDISGAAAP
jgi:arginine/ornithine transport system substrate-binding protein